MNIQNFALRQCHAELWNRQEYRSDDFGQVLSFPEKRYLFFSDDTHQNFLDALKLLEVIRAKKAYELLRHLEIFIRCEEEIYGALIDTAQNYMEGHVARIHLIDDDKSAAQYLLSHHPLFITCPSAEKTAIRPLFRHCILWLWGRICVLSGWCRPPGS